MHFQKKEAAVICRPSHSDQSLESKGPTLSVVVRQQNAEEQHRLNAAIDALLTELVRQHLGRKD